jgi:hypothetical protein
MYQFTRATTCPPISDASDGNHTPTPMDTPTEVQTTQPTLAVSVFDGPVTQPPEEIEVSVSARKDPVYNQIAVVFDGGKGQQILDSLTAA